MFKKKIYVSLTMKLLIVMLVAVAVAFGVFFGCREIGNFLVWKYYLADDAKEARLEAYIEDLEQFARDNKISVNDTDKFAEWSGGKYVYAVLYKDSDLIFAPDWFDSFGTDESDADMGTDNTSGTEENEQTTEHETVQGGAEVEDSNTDLTEETESETQHETDTDTESISEIETETETDRNSQGGIFNDRDFDKYLNEEAREKYQAALNNILAGNTELTPINCTDGILLATVVDYSEDFVYNIVFAISLMCAIAVVGIVMFSNLSRLTSRVKKLAEKVRLVEKGNLGAPLRVSGNDEITALADDVNSMRNAVIDNMTKEKQAWEANASLITAMSHDIRTPLTVLLGYLDLIEIQTENPTNREYIEICKDNALRLKGLSDDMFSYFLVFGQRDMMPEAMEVQSIETMKHIISERVMLMEENGYSFEWRGETPRVNVEIDTMFMNRVIDNIFSNIGKYADPDKAVVIDFSRDGDMVRVVVENKIRHDDTNAESNHIGIKTCERIMEKMGGSFVVSDDGSSFSVALTLPISHK